MNLRKVLRIAYNSCNIKTPQEIKLFLRLAAANFLIIAPVLIKMPLWIYIRHKPSKLA